MVGETAGVRELIFIFKIAAIAVATCEVFHARGIGDGLSHGWPIHLPAAGCDPVAAERNCYAEKW